MARSVALLPLVAASLSLVVPVSTLSKKKAAKELIPSTKHIPNTQTGGPRTEVEIYDAYWWPLEPPPFHHPGVFPTRLELDALQALEVNYTAYWQGLPKYTEISARLARAQQEPYFKVPWKSSVAEIIRGKGPELIFVCHHKTGVNVHQGMQNALKGTLEMENAFEPNSWELKEGSKVLHLIRDPVDMILSGYRYHQNRWGSEIWSWGMGRTDQDPQCFMCDDEDHGIIFDTCHFNCTYFELLNRVDETTGVMLEAVSARTAVTSMAQGLAAWADQENVMQISFDLLKAHPAQTVSCVLKFLGLSDNALLAERLEVETLTVVDPDHVTSGFYDNTHLKEFLESHLWAQDFNALREVIASVYERQAALWGCPAGSV